MNFCDLSQKTSKIGLFLYVNPPKKKIILKVPGFLCL